MYPFLISILFHSINGFEHITKTNSNKIAKNWYTNEPELSQMEKNFKPNKHDAIAIRTIVPGKYG